MAATESQIFAWRVRPHALPRTAASATINVTATAENSRAVPASDLGIPGNGTRETAATAASHSPIRASPTGFRRGGIARSGDRQIEFEVPYALAAADAHDQLAGKLVSAGFPGPDHVASGRHG